MASSGFGPNSGFRFSNSRSGNTDGRNKNFRYPSPWWDVAHMELPTSVRHLFRWCLHHAILNPLVKTTVHKLSSYPVTKVVVEGEEREGFDNNRSRWKDLLHRVLDVHRFQYEVGLDYYTYGNCLVSVVYPFKKHLVCKSCGTQHDIKRIRFGPDWEFKNFDYVMKCKECGHNGRAEVRDVYIKSYRGIKLKRWNPGDINIDFNPLTMQAEYAYIVPPAIRAKIIGKKRKWLEETPREFIDAVKFRRPVVLRESNLFHFKAPTPSLKNNDEGWGYPPILPALKDVFYLQIMKKAQEAVMLEHLVPLDVLFPSSQDPNASPYQMTNLGDWKRKIEQELIRWRGDPNYKPVLPLPIGYQRIGGDGRALMLTQEIRVWSEHIIAGLGVPQEFVFGGLSWTGSSVSLRMLENQFMNYREMLERFLVHFLVPSIARYMGWQTVGVHMKQFKMADDIQQRQLLMSLNQLRKVSNKTLLGEFDLDSTDELKQVEKELRTELELTKLEQMVKAVIQGESQGVLTKYHLENQKRMAEAQAEGDPAMLDPGQGQTGGAPSGSPSEFGQEAPGEEQDGGQGGEQRQNVNVLDLADAWARRLVREEPQNQEAVLQKMSATNPELEKLIRQKMAVQSAMEQDPLPEKGPPRRSAEKAVI